MNKKKVFLLFVGMIIVGSVIDYLLIGGYPFQRYLYVCAKEVMIFVFALVLGYKLGKLKTFQSYVEDKNVVEV